ncbi:uncharacterized protein LOC113330049 [Papaver somniferum]|uniref:uncharacterized protein LOC113330049 n=1 Tax=Papaver somniferum TaxID=3469 RepID=UPI000E6F535B|nr:uncharacterized protein LOC113330049 [Papaver somniferum]XP_026432697.1 uncharacterized protein LOC113330049 [Papaver somniferum]
MAQDTFDRLLMEVFKCKFLSLKMLAIIFCGFSELQQWVLFYLMFMMGGNDGAWLRRFIRTYHTSRIKISFQGPIAQLQMKDCRLRINITAVGKVFIESVTSTNNCSLLLLWKLVVIIEYNFLFFKWIIMELLSFMVSGASGKNVSYDNNHLAQPQKGASVKIKASRNLYMSYCGSELLKLRFKKIQHYPLVLLVPKKFKLRIVLHNRAIGANEVVCGTVPSVDRRVIALWLQDKVEDGGKWSELDSTLKTQLEFMTLISGSGSDGHDTEEMSALASCSVGDESGEMSARASGIFHDTSLISGCGAMWGYGGESVYTTNYRSAADCILATPILMHRFRGRVILMVLFKGHANIFRHQCAWEIMTMRIHNAISIHACKAVTSTVSGSFSFKEISTREIHVLIAFGITMKTVVYIFLIAYNSLC